MLTDLRKVNTTIEANLTRLCWVVRVTKEQSYKYMHTLLY